MPSQIENSTLQDLAVAQHQHDVWSGHIHFGVGWWNKSPVTTCVFFSHFFLSPDRVLCRYWPRKKDCHAVCGSRVLCTGGAELSAWHGGSLSPGKGTHISSGPIDLEYPPPDGPWDVVSIDLLQLPTSHQGSRYHLVCKDHLSRYVALAPVRDNSAKSIAHALLAHLMCPFSTPRLLLNDNGTEFRNQLLEEICKQFGIKQCFTVRYHPASKGLVERANRKILDVLRPVVSGLHHT